MNYPILITILCCFLCLACLRVKVDSALIAALGEEVLEPRSRPVFLRSDILAFFWGITEILATKWRRLVYRIMFTPVQVEAKKEASTSNFDTLRISCECLSYSLDAARLLDCLLLQFRRVLGINRAIILLVPADSPAPGAVPLVDKRALRAIASVGVSSVLLQDLILSADSGVGALITKTGRVLRRGSIEVQTDSQAGQEFDVLGAEVALPIIENGTLLGVAFLDRHINGDVLVDMELEMIFHFLQQVGSGLGNIRKYDQLWFNNEMMTDVLRELSSACIVFGHDLRVLHANKAARRHFGRRNDRTGSIEFSDLPQVLGAKVYEALKRGLAIEPFRYEPENAPGVVYSVSVVPFHRGKGDLASSVLLTADDLSQSEQLRKLEVETASLRLVRTMADRLAHEIGNAMVPLSTHQQLLAEKFRDAEFRESLDRALAGGVKQISRLLNQMRFLAREGQIQTEVFGVGQLIEEAYEDVMQQQPVEGAKLKLENSSQSVVVSGDRIALKHALAEIMLNALQANPKSPHIEVKLNSATGTGGENSVTIEVQDNGAGFSAEAARRVPSPFYTTRNVGLGLGLAVSQKIIETHHGTLEVVPSNHGLVRISLPAEHSASN